MVVRTNNSNMERMRQEVSLFKSHDYDDITLHKILVYKTNFMYVRMFLLHVNVVINNFTLALLTMTWPEAWPVERENSWTLARYIICHHDDNQKRTIVNITVLRVC